VSGTSSTRTSPPDQLDGEIFDGGFGELGRYCMLNINWTQIANAQMANTTTNSWSFAWM